MEKDKKLERIIKEHSLIKAPGNFTENVLGMIQDTQPFTYKPLIGKAGKIIIFIFASLLIGLSIYNALPEARESVFSLPEWKFAFSDIDWNLGLSSVEWKLPSRLLAGLLALFILVLTDARLSKSRTN